jgi:hypothetical protein
VIVTPAGVAHSYEVLGDEPAHVVCIDSPTRPKPESSLSLGATPVPAGPAGTSYGDTHRG